MNAIFVRVQHSLHDMLCCPNGFYVMKAGSRSAEHIKIQDGGPGPGTSIHALWLVTATYFRPTLETLDFLEIF